MIPNARYIENIRGVVYLDSMGLELDGEEISPIYNGLVWDDDNGTLIRYTGGTPSYIAGNESLFYCNKVTGTFTALLPAAHQ